MKHHISLRIKLLCVQDQPPTLVQATSTLTEVTSITIRPPDYGLNSLILRIHRFWVKIMQYLH